MFIFDSICICLILRFPDEEHNNELNEEVTGGVDLHEHEKVHEF